MKLIKTAFFLLLSLSCLIKAQTNDIKIGSDLSQFRQVNGALYDFSEADKINIRVSIWGFVRFPGRYIVPMTTSVMDLISYAGGPTDAANLEDLRLYRTKEDSSYQIFRFNFNSLLYEKEIKNIIPPPPLKASDVIVLPGEPRLYFKDYLGLTLSITSTVISLAILILNIVRK